MGGNDIDIKRRKVIFAESDDLVRKMCVKILAEEGLDVIEAADGKEVIDKAKEYGPEILLLDLNLPRVEPASCVRILKRNIQTRDIAVIVTCQSSHNKSILAELAGAGVSAFLLKPLTKDALLKKIRETVRNAPPKRDPAGPEPVKTTKKVKTNASLLTQQIYCQLHEEKVPFNRYILRTKTVASQPNFFDIIVYKEAIGNNDYVNYNLLDVSVCPYCFFASNYPPYFAKIGDEKEKIFTFKPAIVQAVFKKAEERKKLAGGISAAFFNENRTLEDGITSHELAIRSANALYECDNREFATDILRIGNYHLRIAHLYETAGKRSEVDKHYRAALEIFKQAFTVVEGAALYKTIYQLTAVAIHIDDDRTANQYMSRLKSMTRDAVGDEKEIVLIRRYNDMCQRIWEDREEHRASS